MARLAYDGDGRRVKRVHGSGSIHYVGPHYERNVGTGADTTEIITKLYFAQVGPYRRLVAFRRGGVLYFVHSDHLGGTNILSDVTGNEVGALRYYAFGQTRVQTGLVPTDKLYTGQTLDPYHKHAPSMIDSLEQGYDANGNLDSRCQLGDAFKWDAENRQIV